MNERRQSLVLLSKLQIPQIKTKTLYRKRLIDLLSEHLDKKVILICAGAGYGKTTLLSQFVSTKKIPCIYYHLEKSDAEPAILFSYLIAGIRKIKPEFGTRTENLSHLFNYPLRYLDIIAGTFINEIIEHVKQDLYIILEDYHTLYPSEQTDRIIDYLIERLPPHVHFIITSRVTPPISVTTLSARNEIFELGTQHLRFTKEEIKELFNIVYSISLRESELDWIEEHAEGWPTSLRLMLQSYHYLSDTKYADYIKKILDSYYQSQSNVFNYFAQEIYNQEKKEIQRFLVDCSVFEWLTPELCDAITRHKDSADILNDLTTRNAFIVRIPDVGYRFHNLFRDFLRSKLLEAGRERRLYMRAGNFNARQERFEDAVQFYLEAGAFNKAAALIEKIGSGLNAQGRSGILCTYVEKIPKTIRTKLPFLLMGYSQSLMYIGRAEDARENCLRAVRLLKNMSKARKQYAEALYELGGIELNQRKYNAAQRWYKRALDVCPNRAQLTRASILNSIGSLHTAIGGRMLSPAKKYFQKSLAIAVRNKFRGLEASILNNWAINEKQDGNLNDAYAKLSKTIELLQSHYSLGCGAGYYNAVNIGLQLGYIKEARAILEAGMKACGAYNDLWSIGRLHEGYAVLYEEIGDLQKARQNITKAIEIYEKLGIVRFIGTALAELCKINIKAGDLSEADKNLAKMWIVKGTREDIDAIPLLLTEARLHVRQHKFSEAEETLLHILAMAQKYRHTLNMFLIYIELGKLFYQQGKIEGAYTALGKAVAISRIKDYDYLLLREFEQEPWMLAAVMRENIEKKYVLALIKKSALDIHLIDACFFGVPRFTIDDCDVQESTWKTAKAKKLFSYLVIHKNEKVSQDVLIEALWEGATATSGKDNLRKALQYCRAAIKSTIMSSSDFIVSSKGSFNIAPNISIIVDTEEFEKSVAQARDMKQKGESFEHHVKRALTLYKRGLAEGWYEAWVDELRNHYKKLYEECCAMLANLYVETNRLKEALDIHKRLLALDFYNEMYHRQVMKLYAKLGLHKEIAVLFEQLQKGLSKEFGTKPQQETVALYKSLIK